MLQLRETGRWGWCGMAAGLASEKWQAYDFISYGAMAEPGA